MTTPSPHDQHTSAYEFFIVCVSVWSLLTISATMFLTLGSETRTILHWADIFACAIFFFDFVVTLVRAPNKFKYLATWGWIDLLSSIPAVGPLRYGRIGRLVRIFRVMRAIRSARVIAYFVAGRRAQSVLFTAIMVSLLVLMTSSIAILQVETAPTSNIKTAQDAMWWAISTLATVGSTDAYPVTAAGRLIGAVVMAAGVAVFGIISGVAAAWFLAPVERQEDKDIAELKEMVSGLRAELAQRGK